MTSNQDSQSGFILVVDVGNTSCSFGLARGGQVFRTGHISAGELRFDEFWKKFTADLDSTEPTDMFVASVNPDNEKPLVEWAEKLFNLEAKRPRKDVPVDVRIDLDAPDEIGDDRLLNALAVARVYGTPAIVVDFGTAVTFDVISREGAYLGGAILPGIQMALDALYERTALLPHLDLISEGPVIGKTTLEAMSSGIYYGYAGMIDSMIERFLAEIGSETFVVSTGGEGEMLMEASRHIREWNPELTLRGLAIAYEEHCAAKK
ncbi:MAG: type III pantothenate kinase [Planctomycetota bacterium]|nr:MAG: type III pantothenate kinase [Planctomycetota bacterium]